MTEPAQPEEIAATEAVEDHGVQERAVGTRALERHADQKAHHVVGVRAEARAIEIDHRGAGLSLRVVVEVRIAVDEGDGDRRGVRQLTESPLHFLRRHPEEAVEAIL